VGCRSQREGPPETPMAEVIRAGAYGVRTSWGATARRGVRPLQDDSVRAEMFTAGACRPAPRCVPGGSRGRKSADPQAPCAWPCALTCPPGVSIGLTTMPNGHATSRTVSGVGGEPQREGESVCNDSFRVRCAAGVDRAPAVQDSTAGSVVSAMAQRNL